MRIQENKKLQILIVIALLSLLFFSIVAASMIGSVKIPFSNSVDVLLNQMGINTSLTHKRSDYIIIVKLRFPRIFMAVIVGAMLSVSGVAAQNIFKNPIADPYVIGISSSAGFGAAIVIALEITFFGKFTVPIFSFTFSIITIMVIMVISKRATKSSKLNIYSLLLSGIALSYTFSALISFILFFYNDKSHMILSILMGQLWGTTMDEVLISLTVLIVGGVILFFFGRDMNILLLGDETAQTMGVNVKRSKYIIIVFMTLLTAVAVAFVGSIGFLGLVVPHITRMIFGSDNRKLIVLSAIIGAIFLIWADVLARTLIAPIEIPIGVFTSLLGGPFFLYLVFKGKRGNGH